MNGVYHFMIISGHDVVPCDRSSTKIIQVMHEDLCELDRKNVESNAQKAQKLENL
jgi:hypothetical protein